MHEYIEIQFRRRNRPYRITRQIAKGFEFAEPDPLIRTIDIGFAPADDGSKFRVNRIRQIKGWTSEEFRLRVSTEDGSLVLRGDDEYSLPEGWYNITTTLGNAKVRKTPGRTEVKHDKHGLVVIDLELDERTIEVDLDEADPKILQVIEASTLDGQPGMTWLDDSNIRPTRRACALNLLASLRVFPTLSVPLIDHVACLFKARDERTYVSISHEFYARVSELSEEHDKVYPEGAPRASIHKELIPALCEFDPSAKAYFDEKDLESFRAEGSPSLQMVIAIPKPGFDHRFADLDLDLGNPLQDVVGLAVHIGELLDGRPTNHLDLWKRLKQKKAKPYLYYKVVADRLS